MEPSNLPLEKIDRLAAEICSRVERQRAVSGYAQPNRVEIDATDYVTLSDYWHTLVRHRMALLRFALAGLMAAILISLLETPVYRARTSLEIQDFNDNFLDGKSTDPSDAWANYATAQSYVETQMKVLQSDSLVERVTDKLNLREAHPATQWGAFSARVRRMLGLSRESRVRDREELVREAARNLSVSTAGQSRLLEVLYESSDPKIAADFANTLVSEFIAQSQEMRWKSTQRTAEWLTGYLDETKARLEQSEKQLQDYARTSRLTITSEKDNVAEIRLRELQEELSKAQADRIAKQAKLEEAASKQTDSLPEMLEDPTLRDYRVKLTDLRRQMVELGTTLTPEHYKVERVQAQIAELQSAIQKQRSLILHRFTSEYDAARRREAYLTAAYGQQERIAADQSSKAIHYNTLKREVDSSRQLHEAMLQRVKHASLAAAMRGSNVLVVDPAKQPRLPYKPNLVMNSALGLFSGLFLGLGFALLREHADRRIRLPGDAQVYLNLPELGVLPLVGRSEPGRISDSLAQRRLPQIIPSGRPVEPPAGEHPELETWTHKPSLLAECVRAIMTSIFRLPGENGDHPRVVVLTSPSPGDGKTTVASNLSIAMAEIGRKVLLVDSDLRRPRLHKIFGASNDFGLSDVLWAHTPIETIPTLHLVRETKVAGLYLLPGGGSNVIPANLFYSPRMSKLLTRLRAEFEMVILDAPPTIHLADARVLGGLADGVILVIRAGQTTAESALSASQRFAEDGTRVLGTVLNNWDPDESPNYRYAYGYYSR